MRFLFPAFLSLFLLATLRSNGQAAFTRADSSRAVWTAEWIDADFRRACALARLEQFGLSEAGAPAADSVFYPAVARYTALYENLPATVLPHIFSAGFYERALLAAQAFRHIGIVSALTGHATLVHVPVPVFDPKHHTQEHGGNAHSHN